MRESAFGVEHWEHSEDIVKAFNPIQGLKAGIKATTRPSPGQNAARAKVGQQQRKQTFAGKANAAGRKVRQGMGQAPGRVAGAARTAYTTPLSAQQMVQGIGRGTGRGMAALGRTAQQNPTAAGAGLLGAGALAGGAAAGGLSARKKQNQQQR